jgi:hypothetical protein
MHFKAKKSDLVPAGNNLIFEATNKLPDTFKPATKLPNT